MEPIIRGDDYTINIEVTSTDADGVTTAYNITGAKLWFTIKKRQDQEDAGALIQKTVTSHDNAAGGLTHFSLTSAETTLFDLEAYYYDIQMKTAAGKVMTISIGQIKIIYDITRTTT